MSVGVVRHHSLWCKSYFKFFTNRIILGYFLECEIITITFGRSKIDCRIATATIIIRAIITSLKECASVATWQPTNPKKHQLACCFFKATLLTVFKCNIWLIIFCVQNLSFISTPNFIVGNLPIRPNLKSRNVSLDQYLNFLNRYMFYIFMQEPWQ